MTTSNEKADVTLSVTSGAYDNGNKSFLIDAEKNMRELDTTKEGYLSNAQVAVIVKETQKLRETTSRLKR